ncbi:SubName: Full=Uncharacterized protein {ECO:0000313/EMBL:CCA71572.1} [Serendipita indica DSM 11827]|uniref:Uncharacterized protein n=1 Tax=Serendipita indica (strain DSM 11827) TaxID=1109443 RepID=G4TJS9_SERID|nr:SubName: Full=Uncharacterized protein {ECO:0000313/EMBL:CCA71572.1} [Serendipita indica DSM 11827]CCA71572.1 hypothetical protein PIIN_05509 [Serendipita indica DSM 11827]
MASIVKKRLIFKAKEGAIPNPIDILLTFCDVDDVKFKRDGAKLVAWKVIKFPAQRSASARVTYRREFCFIHPQVNTGNIIFPSTNIPLKLGEQTSLIDETGTGDAEFAKSTNFTDKTSIRVENKTTVMQDIAVGMSQGHATEPDIIYWYEDVGVDQFRVFKPLTVLFPYAVPNYDKGVLATQGLPDKPMDPIDLLSLKPETTWYLTYEGSGGTYKLTMTEPLDEEDRDAGDGRQ